MEAEQPGVAGQPLLGQASTFIRQAASVLEQELAAGINAAKSLENRVIDVKALRERPATDVIQRLRRDAHDAVDIIMDLLAVSTRALERLAEQTISIGQPAAAKTATAPGLATLRPESPGRAGQTVQVNMSLENASDAARDIAGFSASDLLGVPRGRIDGSRIEFSPSPVVIPAHGKAQVAISIAIPDSTEPGTYTGLLTVNQVEVRALLEIVVE